MRTAALVIRVGQGTVRAQLVRAQTPVWAAESAYATEEDLVAVLAALGSEPAIAGAVRTAQVELERPLVQLRTLTDLPPVRESALRALVAHQAGRFFRKNGKLVVTDAAWEPHPRGGSRVALAAAVEEPWLDAMVQGLRLAGLEPKVISPVGSSLMLLPGPERAARAHAMRRRVQVLAALVVGLWAIVGGLALRQLAQVRAKVDGELVALAPAAAAARAVRQDYDMAAAMVTAIENEARRQGTVVSRTAGIVLALPDSAFLTSLHVTDEGPGELTGAARRAPDVVAALERTQVIAAPRLAGPTVHAPIGGRDYERFTVHFGPESAQ